MVTCRGRGESDEVRETRRVVLALITVTFTHTLMDFTLRFLFLVSDYTKIFERTRKSVSIESRHTGNSHSVFGKSALKV